jgi:hypothetical protein
MRAPLPAHFLGCDNGEMMIKDTGEVIEWGAVFLAFNWQDDPDSGKYGFQDVRRCKCSRQLAEELKAKKEKGFTSLVADLEMGIDKKSSQPIYRLHGIVSNQSK